MRQIKLLIKACSVPHLISGYYGDDYPSKTRYIDSLIRKIRGKVAIGNDPSECRVSGIRITDNSLTVIAHEKETDIEVECHSPYELGATNIDWLQQMYEAVWQQLNDNDNNNDNN